MLSTQAASAPARVRPRPDERPSAEPRGIRVSKTTGWLLWATAALNVAFLVGLILTEGSVDPFVNVWLSEATQWVPIGIFWLVAVRTGFTRLEVVLAAAGVTLSAVGDTYYSLAMDSKGYLPFPSVADIGYLLFYPLLLAAVVVLVRGQSVRFSRSMVLDSTVASLGSAAALAVILGPVLTDASSGSSFFADAVAAAYPLFDLILIAVIVGITASPRLRVGPRWIALTLGLVIFTVDDIVYALLEHTDSYVSGTPLDAGWAIGLALMTWWVDGIGRPPRPARPRRESRLVLPVPAFAVAAGLGVLLYGTQVRISPLALVLAAATVGLAAVPVMFRQGVLSRLLVGQEKVLRQLRELDRAKSEMIVTLNHELRTPLTSIRGYLEMVLDGDGGPVPEEAERMLQVVGHNTARLQTLVDDMLIISRLDAQVGPPIRSSVDLDEVLRRVVTSAQPFAKSRNVDLALECGDVSLTIAGDEAQLERAFTNLTQNAVKFTRSGGSVRLVSAAALEGESITAVVDIVDTGIGIPVEDVPQLFTRFFRASNAQTGAVPGTGLGLSIVQGLIEAHEGHVTVTSAVGYGTTFRVTLPALSEESPA